MFHHNSKSHYDLHLAVSDIQPQRTRIPILKEIQIRITHSLHLKRHITPRIRTTLKALNKRTASLSQRKRPQITFYGRRIIIISTLSSHTAQLFEINSPSTREGVRRRLELGLQGEEEDQVAS